ncbi:isopentenyl-diphosphate Delta-isomerase [Sanguibacter antarcticus]|uniref:Isopentenyl-diphosphate Delta-isomerase n=1 Tax=Sanguibacter antarcticus TaxID=372484 RepID=A0A2A9E1M6_9MICO|nr:isopentenyl-diphosphate Delta-isomerase [Sanguibacter antarcticus]PFG32754.1 isopentenyl-diphosphate delta-isomerase [Sanguibacter antarcticus]
MTTHVTEQEDHVVLLDPQGERIGTAARATVHDLETPLHLAFSCYVLRPDGRVLLTRRALSKRTWPGVWTNSFCGHPRQHETMDEAVLRHAGHELGFSVGDLHLVLPDFRYRAVDASGVVENEICPVYFATTTETPSPNPDEVMDVQWVEMEDLGRAVGATPWAFSEWMVLQLNQLAQIELPLPDLRDEAVA